jgi:SAM-dependent methyltransferase
LKSPHEKPQVRKNLASRTLSVCFPELIAYLRPGLRVLDVGCGPGSITLDVGKKVYPGSVVGIDLDEAAIEHADQTLGATRAMRRILGQEEGVNARFLVSRADQMSLDERSFDLSYARLSLEFFPDPEVVLRSMRKSTKKDGLVIALVPDYGAITVYPACPNVEEVVRAMRYWADDSGLAGHFDAFLGRRILELFKQSGLTDIAVSGVLHPYNCMHAGSSGFRRFLGAELDPAGPAAELFERCFAKGVLSRETVALAREDIERWHAHPAAFYLRPNIMAIGKA